MLIVNLWKRVAVKLAIRNRIVGGTPTDPKLIEGWIAANMPAATEADKKALAAKTASELGAAAEEAAKSMWTTFKRDEKGVYIESRQVKAAFKESANVLREALIASEGKKEGRSRFTNLKARLAERLFVEGDKIYLHRDGKSLVKPDGSEERVIHVMTAQGPRTALKRVDFVSAPATIEFTARYLNDGVVDLSLIETLLEHSSWNGLGSDRSQGNGLFDVVSIKEVQS